MKKLLAAIASFACALTLAGCYRAAPLDMDNKDLQTEAPPTAEAHSTEYTIHIESIVDRTKNEPLPCDEAEEMFFRDGQTAYYFSVIKSHYILVHYSDGSCEDIVSALNAGRATIGDLDRFGIEYHTE